MDGANDPLRGTSPHCFHHKQGELQTPISTPPQKPEMKSNHLSDLRGSVLKITYSYYTELCYVSYMLYSIVFDYTVLQYILSYCVIEHRISLSHIYTVYSFDFLPGMRV